MIQQRALLRKSLRNVPPLWRWRRGQSRCNCISYSPVPDDKIWTSFFVTRCFKRKRSVISGKKKKKEKRIEVLKKKCRLNRQSNVFELITPFHGLSRFYLFFLRLATFSPLFPAPFKYIIKLSTSLLLINNS